MPAQSGGIKLDATCSSLLTAVLLLSITFCLGKTVHGASPTDHLGAFHPLVSGWFGDRLGTPTQAQSLGWPSIRRGDDTLIAAPTGSGKTLAAFLVCIDKLLRDGLAGRLRDEVRVLYISPLKALSHDVRRNLTGPLDELSARAAVHNLDMPPLRVLVRTGDTPSYQRQQMVKKPPHILVTTPESLYLLLTSAKSREILRSVDTVIVD